jgi:hypothetical protein
VRRSKLLEHNGDEFQVLLQLYQKSIVTVVATRILTFATRILVLRKPSADRIQHASPR